MTYTISILVENIESALCRIIRLISNNGYKLKSLATDLTSELGIIRITLVVTGILISEKIEKQLNKLIDIVSVEIVQS